MVGADAGLVEWNDSTQGPCQLSVLGDLQARLFGDEQLNTINTDGVV